MRPIALSSTVTSIRNFRRRLGPMKQGPRGCRNACWNVKSRIAKALHDFAERGILAANVRHVCDRDLFVPENIGLRFRFGHSPNPTAVRVQAPLQLRAPPDHSAPFCPIAFEAEVDVAAVNCVASCIAVRGNAALGE